jgi:hypothetical protein
MTLPTTSGSVSMPDPSGCFVLVAAEPGLRGDREFISGPVQHRNLTRLPFGRNWRQRIRSASAGPRATITMWSDESFTGTSLVLRPETVHDQLPTAFDRSVESLTIRCPSATG